MNIIFIILGSFVGLFVLLYVYFWIKSLIPTPKFNPHEYTPIEPDYWPTNGFQKSAPEKQGMDSSKLLSIFDYVQKVHEKRENVSIDSISIYRNGYNVADFCFNPFYSKDELHVVHSVTKSIISILIGIAIDKGFIESVEVPYIQFFEDKQSSITDERMKKVRLKDLLSMQTGIRSRDYALYGWQGLFSMQKQDDWVAYIMSLPVDVDPGTRFDYSNMSSFLLSAILESATGKDTLSFARENLFNPLGIKDVRWEKNPQGIWIGFARMWLKPDDMAKIGMLYLQKGKWDGKQIISVEWVNESLAPQAFPKDVADVLDEHGIKDKELTTRQWRAANFVRPFTDGYGYQWWLDRDGSYSAVGVSGQYIMVVPQKNLVVVVTNSSYGIGAFFPRKILDKFILPSVRSDESIPGNPFVQNKLSEFAYPPTLDEQTHVVSSLPQKAKEISGCEFKLSDNRWDYDNFKLVFTPGENTAEFSYTAKVHDAASFQVGLDGRYHFSDTEIGRFAAKGEWITPDCFEIKIQQIGYSAPVKFRLAFTEKYIQVEEVSLTGVINYSGEKH